VNLIVNKTLFFKVKEAALVMELVDGIPLDQRPPRDQKVVLDIFTQTAKALWALHQRQYVHCDLKPHNLLLTKSGQVKLIDFGQTVKGGTVKDRMRGTPDFIAPEQVKLVPVTVRTDVYCFGATLYWALTGKRIPTFLNVEKSERDIIREGKFPSPNQLNPKVSENLSKLVMECVKMMPKDRPADMAQVLPKLTM